MDIKIYITYDMVFEDQPDHISDYLKTIDKDKLIKIALTFIQNGHRYEHLDVYASYFFCENNTLFKSHVLSKLNEYIQGNKTENIVAQLIPHEYFIISETTGLELLRQAFAIKSFEPSDQIATQEQNLFKAILLLNRDISTTNLDEEYDDSGNLTDLFYAKSLLCTFINQYEYTNFDIEFNILLQVIKGYYFFKFCETSKIKDLLFLFLQKNGFSSWQQYLYNAIKLLLFPLKNNDGKYSSFFANKNEPGYNFLESLSFDSNMVVPLDKNIDYTYFKTKPIIRLNENIFLPINVQFCTNQLYRSVYFGLSAINRDLRNTPQYFQGLLPYITSNFSEKKLFDYFIREILIRRNGVKLSDSDCKSIGSKGHEPDFYFRDGNNIILFENKDIKIADHIRKSCDYSIIEKTLKEKLISSAGISQLIYNIKKIDNKDFVGDNIPNNPRIYPVLVIDDISICVPGLNYILNYYFQEELSKLNIQIKVYPLVVIELDTLISYSNSYKTDKIKLIDSIKRYYSFQRNNINHKSALNTIISDVFQKYFPYFTFVSTNLKQGGFGDIIIEDILNELRMVCD